MLRPDQPAVLSGDVIPESKDLNVLAAVIEVIVTRLDVNIREQNVAAAPHRRKAAAAHSPAS